mmetsp:Transcript_10438/g.31017  ORF Transcript_10438/g.31017 Transcript_10438/m.31017 type:complete len:230 (+) Transcript_10438:1352-2041(+)
MPSGGFRVDVSIPEYSMGMPRTLASEAGEPERAPPLGCACPARDEDSGVPTGAEGVPGNGVLLGLDCWPGRSGAGEGGLPLSALASPPPAPAPPARLDDEAERETGTGLGGTCTPCTEMPRALVCTGDGLCRLRRLSRPSALVLCAAMAGPVPVSLDRADRVDTGVSRPAVGVSRTRAAEPLIPLPSGTAPSRSEAARVAPTAPSRSPILAPGRLPPSLATSRCSSAAT